MKEPIKIGTVKFFKADKGYGFIINDADGAEYFVHASNCIDKIEGGFRVSFSLGKSKKGIKAIDVKII